MEQKIRCRDCSYCGSIRVKGIHNNREISVTMNVCQYPGENDSIVVDADARKECNLFERRS